MGLFGSKSLLFDSISCLVRGDFFCPQGERILSHSVPFYLWELLWFLFLAINGSFFLKEFSFWTSFQLMTHFHLGMTFSWYYITFPFTSVKSCLSHLHHICADEYAFMLPTILNFNKVLLVVFLSLWIDLKGLTWLFPPSVTSLTCLSIVSLSTSRYCYVFIAFYYFFPSRSFHWMIQVLNIWLYKNIHSDVYFWF